MPITYFCEGTPNMYPNGDVITPKNKMYKRDSPKNVDRYGANETGRFQILAKSYGIATCNPINTGCTYCALDSTFILNCTITRRQIRTLHSQNRKFILKEFLCKLERSN
ncbi:unnamed protein product [Orchesella dallaii]|uniref:Uncharacterized protein n=1 Tax=Orchesella dallaii TaxID=48710 RepID=A0ABP1QX65_9HEXA